MDLDRFVRLRPWSYHVTARANLDRIRRLRQLQSTRTLHLEAGRAYVPTRRKRLVPLPVGDDTVLLRDQARLHEGNIAFETGWSMSDLLAHLDDHVFFWPGSDQGPSRNGQDFVARYVEAGEALAVLRVPTRDLTSNAPRFSRCNSGAPRRNAGRAQPRGPSTFLSADAFGGTPGDVIELAFAERVDLPASTEWATATSGPWTPLS